MTDNKARDVHQALKNEKALTRVEGKHAEEEPLLAIEEAGRKFLELRRQRRPAVCFPLLLCRQGLQRADWLLQPADCHAV